MKRKKTETGADAKTKILLVDDHFVVLEGIKKALEKEEDFKIVGTATDGRKAMPMIKSLEPDIVIMDISMPDFNGMEAAAEIRKSHKETAVIVFTMHRDKEYILSLFRTGVSGYLFKDESLDDLPIAVRAVREGGTYYSRSAQQILREHVQALERGEGGKAGDMQGRLDRLSLREKEVFPLLADGLSTKEIADRLCISPKTVETHKYNIMEKLEVHSVTQLTKLAIKKNLIQI